jgi:hypothetical protein
MRAMTLIDVSVTVRVLLEPGVMGFLLREVVRTYTILEEGTYMNPYYLENIGLLLKGLRLGCGLTQAVGSVFFVILKAMTFTMPRCSVREQVTGIP